MYIRMVVVVLVMVLFIQASIGDCKDSVTDIDPTLQKEIPVSKAMQIMIDETVNAFVAIAEDGTGLENAIRHLTKLKKAAGKPSQLVPQLVYYSANMDDMTKGMTSYMIYKWGEITPGASALGLAPYVWDPNIKVRQEVHHRLKIIDNSSSGRRHDFKHYGAVVAYYYSWKKEPLALPIILYMYRLDPGEALLVMNQEFLRDNLKELRHIKLIEHVVSDVIWRYEHNYPQVPSVFEEASRGLDMLSQSPHWWVRLYVAEIMRQHKAFRNSEIIERLKQDKHSLLRKTIESFASSESKRSEADVPIRENGTAGVSEKQIPQNNRDNNVE